MCLGRRGDNGEREFGATDGGGGTDEFAVSPSRGPGEPAPGESGPLSWWLTGEGKEVSHTRCCL